MNTTTTSPETCTTRAAILALADEIEISLAERLIDAQIAEITTPCDDAAELWAEGSPLAARLAGAAVVRAWRDQADAGWFAHTVPNIDNH